MLVVYISGKYRDRRGPWYVNKNIEQARDVAMDVWKLGFAVICPHANTSFFEGPLDDPTIIAGDIELVKRSDAVVVMPNWDTSVGAKMELDAALAANIPLFFWPYESDLLELFGKGELPEATLKYRAGRHRYEVDLTNDD